MERRVRGKHLEAVISGKEQFGPCADRPAELKVGIAQVAFAAPERAVRTCRRALARFIMMISWGSSHEGEDWWSQGESNP